MERFDINEMNLPQLFRETRHVLRRYAGCLKHERFDPEHGQGRIIELLRKAGPLAQKDLAYFLGIRQQSLGELVRKLEDAGYVAREPLPEDKRANIVALTEAGKALELKRSSMSAVFDCLNEEEQDNMKSYLRRICEHVCEMMPEDAPEVRPHCRHGHGRGPADPPGPHHHRPHHHGMMYGRCSRH